jgi:hypothetical protein
MATVLTSARVPGTAPVKMSNGLTSVLLDVLCLAAFDAPPEQTPHRT